MNGVNEGLWYSLRVSLGIVLVYSEIFFEFMFLQLMLYLAFGAPYDDNGQTLQSDKLFWWFLSGIPEIVIYTVKFSIVPFLLVLVFSEFRQRRRWRYFFLGGLFVSAVVTTIIELPRYLYIPRTEYAGGSPSEWFILFLGTAVLSLPLSWTYWLIAGRHAGLWKRPLA